MQIFSKLGLLTAGVVITSTLGVTIVAAAPTSHAHEGEDHTSGQPSDMGSQRATKQAEAKLKVCHNREKAINNKLGHIAERGQKQLDLFTSIATRVETFYTDKGKTLSNYDALVADVNAKKDAAQAEVDVVKASSVSFKCDGTDPKGAVSSFKVELKAEIAALKAYKTSVKNLIVGVKSVQGSTTSAENRATGGTQ